jgi:dipeptidyl aminopeptidase/acylaminoacyl peptidase
MSASLRAITPEDLLRLTSVSDVQISPDGRTIAYVAGRADLQDDSNKSAIWLVPADGGAPRRFTYGDHDSAPRWSPDGRTLAFLSDRAGKPQIFVLPADGGEASKLTDLPDGAGVPVWSPDGARIAFAARVEAETPPTDAKERERWARRPRHVTTTAYKADGSGFVFDKRSRIFIVDVEGGDARPLTGLAINATDPAWSPDGRTIAFVSARPEDRDLDHPFGLFGASQLCTVAVEGGAVRELCTLAKLSAPVFSPDGGTIAVYSSGPNADDFFAEAHVWLVPIGGGAPRDLTPRLERSRAMLLQPVPCAWSADGARVFFPVSDRGNVHLYSASVAGGEAALVIGGERKTMPFTYAAAAGRIAFVTSDPRTAQEVAVARDDGGDERRLTNHNGPLLQEFAWQPVERRTFSTPNGDVEGWLRLPVGGALPAPLLVLIHGGPQGAFGSEFLPIEGDTSHAAAGAGWAVLMLNPHGSSDYGRSFAESLVGRWGEFDLPEHLAAVDALIAEGIADPERLAVSGYSYGGYMTSWTVGQTDRFKAAIIGAPVANLESMLTSDAGIGLLSRYIGGRIVDQRAAYRRLSPATYFDRVTTPCLILQGEADDRCPISQGEEFFAGLRLCGVPAEMVRYPGGSHGFRLLGPPSHRLDYVRRVLAWIERWVPAQVLETREAVGAPGGE